MPNFLANRQNILLIVFLLVIIIGGYLWYSYYSPAALEAGVTSVALEKEATKQEFFRLLDSLETIKLDRSIFQEPIFQSLVNLSPEIAPREKKGRPNPFLPL